MTGSVLDIKSLGEFESLLRANKTLVVHFWAPWCEPCTQLDRVLAVLATEHAATFARVEAEEITDVSLKYEVSVVPLFLFFQGGAEVGRVEGADVAALTAKVKQFCPSAPSSTVGGALATFQTGSGTQDSVKKPSSKGPQLTEDALRRVKDIVESQRIVLLMKGTPAQPRCGFSSRVVAILHKLGSQFGSFDILSDDSIRQAAKAYADWPSYPQLYIDGEMVGGCDIVEDMEASGELKQLIGGPEMPGQSLNDRLRGLVSSSDVMLFMKGSPEAPRCGFSSKVVQALRGVNVKFGSFDILEDQEVREGLKKFSDWPTYPQLYAGGELVGGCDIILELLSQHQLKPEIESLVAAGRKS